jgi:hypothetical protein
MNAVTCLYYQPAELCRDCCKAGIDSLFVLHLSVGNV